MKCPSCGNTEERTVVKNGFVRRKKRTTDPKVQRWLCSCGYTARGSAFGLPEGKEEVKKEESR